MFMIFGTLLVWTRDRFDDAADYLSVWVDAFGLDDDDLGPPDIETWDTYGGKTVASQTWYDA